MDFDANIIPSGRFSRIWLLLSNAKPSHIYVTILPNVNIKSELLN